MINDATNTVNFKPVIVSYEDWPDNLEEMISWCEINTVHRWAYGLHHAGPGGNIVYAFYFNDDHDWIGFKLAWGIH